ncbi:SDR family NAD(P)-dependent oxidoreductase [Nocardia sp. NPDC003482]
MQNTTDRVAVITGSSRGIGRAVALRLAARGVAVVGNYRTDAAAAARVVADIESRGGRAMMLRADVANPGELRTLFDAAQRHYGGLDVLVHNAAGFVGGPLDAATEDDYRHAFSLNAHATFLALRQAGLDMRPGGRIVFVSSAVTRVNPAGQALYAASKAAGEHLVRTAARELGARGITVNSVLPGPTDTDLFASSGAPVDVLLAQTPLGRLAEPGDIADVVDFLASDAARWITGQSIAVDGGLS